MAQILSFQKYGNTNDNFPTRSQENILNEKSEQVVLKRKIGLMSATSMLVGTIIGSGIFISPSGALNHSGSVGLSLIVWLVAGIISMFGALCFAELGACIPKSGAEYIYMLEAFQPLHPIFGAIPSFLFFWMSVIIIKPTSLAIIALTFAKYVSAPLLESNEIPEHMIKLLAALCITLVIFVNCFNVKLAAGVQNIFTLAKVIGLVIISIGGIVMLFRGHTENLATGFQNTNQDWASLSEAFFSTTWAYGGWNCLNFITEEIRNPEFNFPLSICIGMPLVMICYLLANVAYFTVMSVEEIIDSDAVAVVFGNRVLGIMSWTITVAVIMSTFGAANGDCFTAGRLPLVAAREGHMMELLSYIHVKRFTPVVSLIFNATIALIMIIPGDIDVLINMLGYATWLFFGGTFIALIVMRFTHKEIHRPFKVCILIPFLLLLVSLYLVIAPIYNDPKIEYTFSLAFIPASLCLYIPFVYFKIKFKIIDKVTTFFQLILQVIPSKLDINEASPKTTTNS